MRCSTSALLPVPVETPRARSAGWIASAVSIGCALGIGLAGCGGGGGGSGGGGGTAPETTRVYLAADDHTDYFWTADEEQYRQIFLETLDYYVARADAAILGGVDSQFQSRWNCDGNLWLWTYEKGRTTQEFEHLIERIGSGHVSVPLNALCVCLGAAPLEMVLRGMYYPGRIERRYGVRFPLAYQMENQTLPLGVASLWAGSGARWSWKGICGCDTQIPDSTSREHEIYHARGLDGQGVLLKWNSQLNLDPTAGHPSQSVGGYAEAYNPDGVVEIVTTDAAANGFAAVYPYSVIGCFGQGWDGPQTMNQLIVDTAIAKTGAGRDVIVSNEADFFEDFAETYDVDSLPTQATSFGNEWELNCAGLAEVTARIERALERLRAAEALAALECRLDPGFMSGREEARDQAFMDLGLYYEHDFGMVPYDPADPKVIARIAWQRRITAEVEGYVDTLLADGSAALGERITQPAGAPERFFAFNPLGHQRSDVADYPYDGPTPVHVIDVDTNLEVPSQIVELDGQTFLRVLARDVPAVGYRVFEIQPGAGQVFGDAAVYELTQGWFDSERFRVLLDPSGAILSLVDHQQGDAEQVDLVAGRWMNDLGGAGGDPLVAENVGPVSVTLVARSSSPVQHTTRVTLYREGSRVDVRNEITQNFTDVQTWGFGFMCDAPLVHHEEVGAILTARLASQGGHYSDRALNSRYDWLSLGHFVDLSEGNGPGLTLSNRDCPFFRLGASDVGHLDTSTPGLEVVAGGDIAGGDPPGLREQGGDSYFLQRFALAPHAGYDPAWSMRVALEHHDPLVCGQVTGQSAALPPDSYSAVTLSDPDVLLWALKPAEEGPQEGYIARLWNVGATPATTTIQLAPAPIVSAWRTTHIETDEEQLTVGVDGLQAGFVPQQVRTFRLRVQ